MGFKANQVDLNAILSRNISYIIPKNQRKYVWSEREWNELFEDIFLIEQKEGYNHFLGSFVFSISKSNNVYCIIDGQQRLITISLIFSAIINNLYKIGEGKIAESFKNNYLQGSENGETYFKIRRDDGNFFLTSLIDNLNRYLTNEGINKIFEDEFGRADRYNKTFLDCYFHFNNKVCEYLKSKKKALKDTLISLKEKLIRCEVIEISVGEESDAYRIFETLNARGIPLEQHELVKNFIYSYMRTSAKQQKVSNIWEKIIQNLTHNDTDSFSAFLSHYCSHIYGKVKKNEEFKVIRENTPKSKVEELLTELNSQSVFYKYIIDPESYKEVEGHSQIVYISLKYFKDLNIRQVRPLLLSIFEKHKQKQLSQIEFEKCFCKLETFYFIFSTLLKSTTNIIDSSIISLAKYYHESDFNVSSEQITQELSKFISEKQKALDAFPLLGYSNKNKKFSNSSNKKIVNYIYYKFEKYYDINDELTPKISSIEHILNDDETNDYASYIGNLLPLSIRINGNIKNKNFIQKIVYYKKSNLLTVKRFIGNYGNYTSWESENILERGKHLAKVGLENIWLF